MKKSADFNIDDLYKGSFENANLSFDKGSMWNEVESQLPGQERKFLFWLSWGLGILLLSYFLILASWRPAPSKQHVELSALPATSSWVTSESNVLSSSKITPPNSPAFIPAVSKSEKETPVSEKDVPEQKETSIAQNNERSFLKAMDKDQKISKLKVDNSITKFSIPPSETLSSNKPLLVDKKEETLSTRRPDPNNWSRCSVKDRPLYFSDIYAFGGYPLISNSVNPDPSNDYNAFLDQWNEGEEAVSNYGFGMMVGIGAHWGGSFSTGLEFQQIQNKLNRSQTVIERITVYDEMAYYYLDSNNNRIWVADSVTSTRVYNREVQAAKTHTLINVPFLLGYHLEYERLRVGVVGGVNLHVMNQYEGKVLDPSGQIIDATTGTPTAVYDTNIGVSYIGGFDLGYFITMQTEFYVSPRFRFNPRSWLNPTHPLESRIQMVNLQAGARWHF